MTWQNAADFWAMGGHGFYVWGALLVFASGLAFELVALYWRHRQVRQAVRRHTRWQRAQADGRKGQA